MRNKFSKLISTGLLALAIAGTMTTISPVTAYAATEEEIKEYIQSDSYADGADDGILTKKEYNKLSSDDKKNYTEVQITDADGDTTKYYYNTSTSAVSDTLTDSTFDSLSQFNLKADVDGAANIMSGFTKVFQYGLGILVTLITIGMTVFTGFDIAYIAFPAVRQWFDTQKENGTKGMTRTDAKTGATKLTLVTEDAQFAVVSADMANTGKSPFVIYLQKRVISFVVLAVLLFVLLTGNINVITNIGVKLAAGFIKLIQGI